MVKNVGHKISIVLPDELKEEIDKLREIDHEDQSIQLFLIGGK